MRRHSIEQQTLSPLFIGLLVFTVLALFFDVRNSISMTHPFRRSEVCQGKINAQVLLSREQLAQLLTISERDSKDRVFQIVGEPYCQLPSLQVRAGVTAERQIYPLAFDPQTWLVILYEGNEYAGYRFSYQ